MTKRQQAPYRQSGATITWVIKRRPLGKSYFRDGFLYFERVDRFGGSYWAMTRREARRFTDRLAARLALFRLRTTDTAPVLVRVTTLAQRKSA